MKTIILLVAILPFISLSQLNVTNYFTANTQEAVELHSLPFDDSRLIEVIQGAQNPNLPAWNYIYEMAEITGGIMQSYVIPLCTNLSKPVFLENGILTGGEYFSGGQELIYWDGTNLTLFDLDSLGDSNPQISIVQGEVYVIAANAGKRKAYLFDENTLSIELIAWNEEPINQVIASFNGDYFYQCSFQGNSFPTEYLWGTDNQQGSLTGSAYAGIYDTSLFYNYPHWRSPIIKNNKLYLVQEHYNQGGNANCNFQVLSIEPNPSQGYITTVLLEEDQVLGGQRADIFEWEGDLYYYRGGLR